MWGSIVEPLADAFLRYKYGAPIIPEPLSMSTQDIESPKSSAPDPTCPVTARTLPDNADQSPPSTSANAAPTTLPSPSSDPPSIAYPGSPAIPTNGQQISYTVQVFCLFTLERSATILRPPESVSAAVDLMANGYVAKSPAQPTIVVSLKTLELLYRLRRRKASFSIEAFAKLVCDYYQVSN